MRRHSAAHCVQPLELKSYKTGICFFVFGATDPQWTRASSFTRFLDHTQRPTTVGRTPLDELSDRRRDLYLITHNTHNRQISMPPVGFEPTISAGERPQTYALDRAATGIGNNTGSTSLILSGLSQIELMFCDIKLQMQIQGYS